MASLQSLNAFICERLTAAAAEIFGAVEKTVTEYEGEISRSKQEVDQLRSLLWPEVRLHRSAASQVSPQRCHEEERAPDGSTLHIIKEEHDQRADQPRPSCRQQSDTAVPPQSVKGDEEPPSHLYRILTVDPTADIKAEPDGEEFKPCASTTREGELACGGNPESAGLQREIDPLQITHHEQNVPVEQQYIEPHWSTGQDHKDPDPPLIKVETSSSSQEETNRDYKLQTNHSQILTNTTFGGDGCQLSRNSQPFYSVNQSEYGENTDGVVNREWINVLTPTVRKPRRRQNAHSFDEERRHICPFCAKRFKESNHLKDHVRIHTGEKPFRCKECGMNFRQSGALTLHMRIHTGERPFQCPGCDRRFVRKGDMETHMVMHTGERPHLCLVCGKTFKRRSNLHSHLKIHAEGRLDYVP